MAYQFGNEYSNHYEHQELDLCAKHAMNHLLQEEKTVWKPDSPKLYIRHFGSKTNDPMSNGVKINLSTYCKNKMHYNMSLRMGMRARNLKSTAEKDDLCEDDGMLPYPAIQLILSESLNYETRTYYNLQKDEQAFKDEMKKNNVLGAIINLGNYHYTAITKFSKYCNSWYQENEGKPAFRGLYHYVDSVGQGNKNICGPIEVIIKQIKPKAPTILVVYATQKSYDSIAKQRLDEILSGPQINPDLQINQLFKGGRMRRRTQKRQVRRRKSRTYSRR